MEKGVEAIKKFHALDGLYPDPVTGLLDITVSFDGSWLTRGHHSNIGAGFVIHFDTGIVLDMEILSKHCQQCKVRKKKEEEAKKKKIVLPPFIHKKCNQTWNESSSKMEQEAARKLWGRSTQYGLRYTKYIGDGDTATYGALLKLAPYGTQVVEKEECLNHMGKRMGYRLKTFRNSLKRPTKTGTGRQLSELGGLLTDYKIGKLQDYYAQALRGRSETPYTTVEQMRDAVFASFFHALSTEDNQLHHLCPDSTELVNSWCFVKRHEADPSKPRRHHDEKPGFLTNIPEKHIPAIMQIYIDLTTLTLLKRCLANSTQNANESFHSKVR